MRGLVALLFAVPILGGCALGSSKTDNSHAVFVRPRVNAQVAQWMTAEQLPAKARPGARLFATAGCTACHTYDGAGSSNLRAPALTTIGVHKLGIRLEIEHLRCPSCVTPGSPMPPFKSLGTARLHELAVFLEASKGTH